ncbi:hypothetical protein MKW98_019839 [Papaver atlanticum]|uniref:Uncharacterized protein n=1 Tax=Papaver atlanticum TaxID=357466 RepID=A0AAD4S145_9MAGN|nr:hypothetical protein MKW98_019839 [Papaver atlanticum]
MLRGVSFSYRHGYELSTLQGVPALFPDFSTAAGEILLLIVKHAELRINKTSREHLNPMCFPCLCALMTLMMPTYKKKFYKELWPHEAA